MDFLILFLVMVLLLLLKGFFSGSEIALVNSDKFKMHHKANQGHRGAKLVLRLFETPDVLLGTTLVGTNIATIILTTLGTMLMIRSFGQLGDLYAVLLFTPLFLVLGEIVPKSVYQQKSNEIAPVIVYPLQVFSILFYPLVFVFSRIARFCARLAGGGKGEQNVFITREQMRMVVDMAERGANVDVFDRVRIKRVIRFAETSVGEAMIPVADITAINRNRDARNALTLVRRRGYNRLPVYTGNISNIVGVVTLTTWDLMDPELPDRPLEDIIKPAHYVSPYQTIDQLLPVLRNRDDHMAIVVDEFGSAIGILTMEDVFEEVVGEIDVGYDFEEYHPKQKSYIEHEDENTHLMSGRMPISEVNDILYAHFPTEEAHTIGGLIVNRLRYIPSEGDTIEEQDYKLTVLEADARSVIKVQVERL